jgi:hypothetical protein
MIASNTLSSDAQKRLGSRRKSETETDFVRRILVLPPAPQNRKHVRTALGLTAHPHMLCLCTNTFFSTVCVAAIVIFWLN